MQGLQWAGCGARHHRHQKLWALLWNKLTMPEQRPPNLLDSFKTFRKVSSSFRDFALKLFPVYNCLSQRHVSKTLLTMTSVRSSPSPAGLHTESADVMKGLSQFPPFPAQHHLRAHLHFSDWRLHADKPHTHGSLWIRAVPTLHPLQALLRSPSSLGSSLIPPQGVSSTGLVHTKLHLMLCIVNSYPPLESLHE